MSGSEENPMVNNKVIPVMRDSVTMVQMVLFKMLRQSIHDRYVDESADYHTQLAGAVVNNLFGTRPHDMGMEAFAATHRELVERELRELPATCPELLPVLTDGLRMKTICDNQEGIHSIGSLLMAKALGILDEARELPMPSTFMLQVRALAAAHGLIEPMEAGEPPEA